MKRSIGLLAVIGALLIGAAVWAQDAAPTPLEGEISYTVQRGDVLDLIAAYYDVDTACVIAQNDLPNSGVIFTGDVLVISDTCPRYAGDSDVRNPRQTVNGTPGTYIIGRGDVLDLIAAYFNLDLACLLERNEIDNVLLLQPGQTILLPSDCPPYAGLSTPRPDQIRGLLARADATATPTRRATRIPPTATLTPTQIPPTSTSIPPTSVPPTATLIPPTPVPPTQNPPLTRPTITPTGTG
jgi:LysM repeat protein